MTTKYKTTPREKTIIKLMEMVIDTLSYCDDLSDPAFSMYDVFERSRNGQTNDPVPFDVKESISDDDYLGRHVFRGYKTTSPGEGAYHDFASIFAQATDVGDTEATLFYKANEHIFQDGQIQAPLGIKFNDNTLTQYKTGSWTPSFITLGGTTPSLDYNKQKGAYTRIGNLVYCEGYIRLKNTDITGASRGSGDWGIGGLPFDTRNDDNFCGYGVVTDLDTDSWTVRTEQGNTYDNRVRRLRTISNSDKVALLREDFSPLQLGEAFDAGSPIPGGDEDKRYRIRFSIHYRVSGS